MKETIIQFWQWILKHRKRLIYGILVFLVGQICFFGVGDFGIDNQVFADSQEDTFAKNTEEKLGLLSFVEKIIYVLIYPMLVVAGNLVDNSMVYGEVFNFDVVLRNLWNIMRNMANFTLGFIFIYKVFKYLIGGKKGEDIKKLLRGLLIAGIGIQASWFIMAALIDASTILTYTIGGLPLTVLNEKNTNETIKNSTENNDPYILKTVINVDVNDPDVVNTYLTNTKGTGHFYIPECATKTLSGNHTIIVGPSNNCYVENKDKIKLTTQTSCHHDGQVYNFNSLYIELTGRGETPKNEDECKNSKSKYSNQLKGLISEVGASITGEELIGYIRQGQFLEEGDAHVQGGIPGALRTGTYPNSNVGLDVDNKTVGSGQTAQLHEVLDTKSYVGTFTLLYASLMNSGKGIIKQNVGSSDFTKLLSVGLSLGHLIAIGIPLIVAAIVFMIRIGILRIAIVISPFIAIMTAFEDDFGKAITDKIKFLETFKLTKLIGIIFSPAIICLAISLSTVLVVIIGNVDFGATIGADNDEILGGLVKINIEGVTAGVRRFFKAIFGAAITWYILWAAIESTKLGEMGIVKSLKSLAQTTIGSIPIVPIPGRKGEGVKFIGANTAFGLNGSSGIVSEVSSQIKNIYREKENRAITDWFNERDDSEHFRDAANSYIEKIGSMTIDSNTPWTEQPITMGEKGNEIKFNSNLLDDAGRESIIKKINNIDNEKRRKEFGVSQPKVIIGDKTYEFIETEVKDGKTTDIYQYKIKQDGGNKDGNPSST